MHEKNKYRHIPWNRYNLEKYRDTDFWSYRPALICIQKKNLYTKKIYIFLQLASKETIHKTEK